MAISSGNITDELIQRYIEEQEGEPMELGQFEIDLTQVGRKSSKILQFCRK